MRETRWFTSWLPVAALSATVFNLTVASALVPLLHSDGIEYLFVPGTPTADAIAVMVALVPLMALYVAMVRVARTWHPERIDAIASGRWLTPLCPLALVPLGFVVAIRGIGEHAAPLAFFTIDLKWWWLALALGGVAYRLARLLQPSRVVSGSTGARANADDARVDLIAAAASPWRLFLCDAAVFAGVIVWAVLTTSNLRFSAVIHGDEPKYLRHIETLDQGHGFEISANRGFDERPIDAPFEGGRDLRLLSQAIRDDARDLMADIRGFAAHPRSWQWNRATAQPGWFLNGKNGGQYQVHSPGLSLLLLPAYYVDAHLLSIHAQYPREFPDGLVMTNVAMLLMYALCAVAIFRMFRHVLGSESLAAIWAVIAMVSLPVTAFAFQFYPEIPAALFLAIVLGDVLFGDVDSSAGRRLCVGMMAAALVWLHPRFLVISVVLFALGAWRLRGRPRIAFVAGHAATLLAFCEYAYHVTGSGLPTAFYGAAGTPDPFNLRAVPMNLLAAAVDSTWGALPHAPILLLAVPALVWLARERPFHVGLIVVLFMALAIPAAGHGRTAAGATPDRHLVAVMPLLFWPIAMWSRRAWRSTMVRAVLIILVALSIDAACAYNWSHVKDIGPLIDSSASGWKPNLIFPVLGETLADSSRGALGVLACLIAVEATLAIYALRRLRTRGLRPVETLRVRALVLTIAGVVAIVTVATAMNGVWWRAEYVPDFGAARLVAAERLLAFDHCPLCSSSRSGTANWTSIVPNDVEGIAIAQEVGPRGVALLHLEIRAAGDAVGFGRARLDYGDGAASEWFGVIGERMLTHVYAKPGRYHVSVTLLDRARRTHLDRQEVDVQ